MKKIKIITIDDFEMDVRMNKIAQYFDLKFDVEIIEFDKKNIHINKKSEKINNINVTRFFCREKSKYIKIFPYLKRLIYMFYLFKYILQVKKYLKNREYDYLYCSGNYGTLVGNMVKKRSSKIIYDMREFYQIVNKKTSKIVKAFDDYLCKKADYIVYVNEKQKQYIKSKNYNKLIFIPNYVKKEHYKDIEKTKCNKIRINYIGCSRDYKSLKNLIDAANNNEEILIGIHGLGDAYGSLKKISAEYNNLSVTGKYNGIKESEKIFKNTDVLMCCYDVDILNWKYAFAVKLFESIITLTPIIVYDNSNMGEFVKKYDIGYTVIKNEVDEFKKTLNLIVDDKNAMIRKIKNLKKIQFEYTWEKVINNIDCICDK
ncbi:MAG: glycosyltransferase [Clostridia bacterium]